MDFDLVPFGNAYFVTDKCGGAGEYVLAARQCYNAECGAAATNIPNDCFSGTLVCQHGPSECIANRFFACAKQVSSLDALKYMPLVTCMEAHFGRGLSEEHWGKIASSCASSTGFDDTQLSACYSGSDRVVEAAARATPAHPGVPYVVVNGKYLDSPDTLLRTVCDSYKGTPPAGCVTLAAEATTTNVIIM